MYRRHVIITGLTLTGATLAGCMGDDTDPPSDNGDDDPRDDEQPDHGGETSIGGIVIPPGFTAFDAPDVDEIEVTIFVGSGSADETLDLFWAAAEDADWTPVPEGIRFGELVPAPDHGDYTGYWFERDEMYLLMQVMEANGEVSVTVHQIPHELVYDNGPVDNGDPDDVTEPPTNDVHGEDLDDVPRYPDSVRIAYTEGTWGEDATRFIDYLTPATMDDIVEFYESELPEHGWMDVMGIPDDEESQIYGEKDESLLVILVRPSTEYPGYNTIQITYSPSG